MIELNKLFSRLSGRCRVDDFYIRGEKNELFIKYELLGKKIVLNSKISNKKEYTKVYSKFVGDREYKEIDQDTIIYHNLKVFAPIRRLTNVYKFEELIEISNYEKFKLKIKGKSLSI